MEKFKISTKRKEELLDTTENITRIVKQKGISEGICHIFILHATAGIVINECADPAVSQDLLSALKRIAPDNALYEHSDGNAEAHIKSAIIGCSKTIFVKNNEILLGTWQGIFLAEFDGPKERTVIVDIKK